MSKAFTKDDAADAPLLVRPRAPLPEGVPNYVTARGLGLLRSELADLEAERAHLDADVADDAERDLRRVALGARIAALAERIAGATIVDPATGPLDRVRFGAVVTVRTVSGGRVGEERRFEIVGVDEADAAQGRVAFLSPIARALMRLEAGDTASLATAAGEEILEVTAVE